MKIFCVSKLVNYLSILNDFFFEALNKLTEGLNTILLGMKIYSQLFYIFRYRNIFIDWEKCVLSLLSKILMNFIDFILLFPDWIVNFELQFLILIVMLLIGMIAPTWWRHSVPVTVWITKMMSMSLLIWWYYTLFSLWIDLFDNGLIENFSFFNSFSYWHQ